MATYTYLFQEALRDVKTKQSQCFEKILEHNPKHNTQRLQGIVLAETSSTLSHDYNMLVTRVRTPQEDS